MDIVLAELPRIFIICLGDETYETVKSYNILSGPLGTEGTVFVVADEEEKKFFLKYTELRRIFFLDRPVSLFALYEKLVEIEHELERQKDMGQSAVEEYLNPNAEYRKKHILVVDDDSNQLIQVREFLKEFYQPTLVKSGDAALKYLERNKVDLILLDYLMPEKNGAIVFKELRARGVTDEVPVIFLTGVTEKETVIRIVTELKPQGYIVKPSKKSELIAKIIEVLG